MNTNTAATASKNHCHEDATIVNHSKLILPMLGSLDFESLLKNENGQCHKSQVAVGMGSNSEMDNFNRASPSFHVKTLLNDVLRCLGVSGTTAVSQEMSIFSMRPDVVVVRRNSIIVLVVEVKNPGGRGHVVVQCENAAGQMYDYSMGLRQMGVDYPIVCLSTYDNSQEMETVLPLLRHGCPIRRVAWGTLLGNAICRFLSVQPSVGSS